MLESIGTAIATVNGSIELVRAISGASGAIEKAELKLKAAEVIGSLADVKIALVDSQDEAREQLRQIAELREALEIKGTVVKFFDAIYLADESGAAQGDPFCLSCWQNDHRLRHLVKGERNVPFHHCSTCKAQYLRSRSTFALGSENPD